MNDGDFMNEFKLHWTVSNFATYYNRNSSEGNNITSQATKTL